ncbi:MAG: tryptophan-rich sensory protein [Clostridia bacterium]|nr:tryptophan-rich sensory protein [Clostridia bacterium]
MKLNWKKLLFCLFLPLGVGGLSAFFTRNSISVYDTINKPAFAPPGWVFPIVWIVLYILMGIASYRISESSAPTGQKNRMLLLYGLQLFFNFVWPLFFFGLIAFYFAFMWLCVMWVLILWLMVKAYRWDRVAFWCLVPYEAWVTFAGVLNWFVAQNNL